MLHTRERDFDSELLDIKRELAVLDVELKLCKLIYLLRKYSPGQPRVPAGSAEGGQWTGGGGSGGGGGGGDQGSEADAASEGDFEPTDFTSLDEGRNASEGDNDLPYVPKERPGLLRSGMP